MNRLYRFLGLAAISTAALVFSGSAVWGSELVLIQPAPDWVVDAGAISPADAKRDGLIIVDRQQKVDGDRLWAYSDLAIRASSSDTLAGLGNISLSWHPDKGDLIVHRVEIIRDGSIIDVLKSGRKFTVLRREQNLEQQWINGILTATMQIEGLKIGDILRFSTSTSFADAALGGNVEITQPLLIEPIKIAKSSYRLLWPENRPLNWRITTGNVQPQVSKQGGLIEVKILQPLPKQPDKPDAAPARFVPPDFFEVSSFASWNDVSKITAPLYATKGAIAPGSPLAARIEAIAARSADPKLRAAAALRMVQDEVRYLFNGQTQGNYVPQQPAETWEKRYGDCKAKTLLLVAMLRALGIEAEPALVSASLGDLVAIRLPSLGAFNHVITRAVIDGQTYWLDGTALGTRLADLADPPSFSYALPVRGSGSGLEPIVYAAPARPLVNVDTEIDASAGLALPKLFRISIELRNAELFKLRRAQSLLDDKKLNEAIDAIVEKYLSGAVISKRSLVFDDDAGSVRVSAEGVSRLTWYQEGDLRQATIGTIISDFDLDINRSRPAWKDIPVTSNFPNYYKSRYRVRLPDDGKGFRLENPKDIAGRFAAYDMNVKTRFEGNLFEIDEAWKTSVLETSAADLPVAREKIARAKAGEIQLVAPANYPTELREARAARAAGRVKRIAAAYALDIAQDPENPQGYRNRAAFLEGIDDKAGAIADITRIIELGADEDSYLWRASLYESIDPKKALADIDAARAINPSSASAVSQLGEILIKQRRFDEALSVVEGALPLQKDPSNLQVLKADILARAGRTAEALALINKANANKPGNPVLLNGRCWVKAVANVELDTALKDCTKAIELTDNPSGILDSRGLVYLRLQRYDDAIADLDAALRLRPNLASSLFVRGVARSFANADSASPDIASLDIASQGRQDIDDAVTIRPSVAADYLQMGVEPKSRVGS